MAFPYPVNILQAELDPDFPARLEKTFHFTFRSTLILHNLCKSIHKPFSVNMINGSLNLFVHTVCVMITKHVKISVIYTHHFNISVAVLINCGCLHHVGENHFHLHIRCPDGIRIVGCSPCLIIFKVWLFIQQLFIFFYRHWSCKIKSLHIFASDAVQKRYLLFALRTLSYDRHVQPLCHADYRCQNVFTPAIISGTIQKLHINFQDVNRNIF